MNRIKTKTDIIYNNYLKKDITIVHISDIHFSINTKFKVLDKISNEIRKIKPDYIMITGDLIDEPSITNDKKKIKELLTFLSNIAKISKVFVSLGNHDIFTDDDIKFFNKINDLYNIYILNNKSYQDEYVYVTGFTLPYNYYYNITGNESPRILANYLDDFKKLINKLPKNTFKIALIHSPICLTDKIVVDRLHEYDLILSGHTHNGMVPDMLEFIFPKNRGIISPRKGLFPEIARGKIEQNVDNKIMTIIINGAITKLSNRSGLIFRNLNFLYNKSVNKIIIKRKRGIKNEN